MTNADYIRNMTDDELAEFIHKIFPCKGTINIWLNYKNFDMNDNVKNIRKFLGKEHKK